MAGAADPLQAARDRLGRLDLDDEVDGAHVDPELEGRRGDEGGDLATFEELFDLDALLTRQRAVVRAGDLALRELVQPQGKPLGQPAVVDEDDRRAVALDELQELGVDRRPDRVALPPPARAHSIRRPSWPCPRLGRRPQVELLRPPGVDQLDVAPPGDEAADLVERPLGRREADALHRLGGEALQPLEDEREVGAPLATSDGVHLVHDHEADVRSVSRARE